MTEPSVRPGSRCYLPPIGSAKTTVRSGTAAVPEETHILQLLKRVFHYAHRAVNDSVRPYGVTATQMGALNRVALEPGLSGAELARRLLVTTQAAQLALTALQENGFIDRIPDPNHGRIVRTYLTAEGRRVLEKSMRRGLEAESEFLDVLDADEQDTLTRLLRRLVED